ncbi:hypothetical protein [Gluconobacter thailandicus]|uniref:Uncharacterized protein n=1 Tax=Gluconobacter thailandicus TaxID=257438 RepID=A0AAP9ETX6_GLUTH|nr:hypothetical protein [Gluconobacter thailandicus]QEH97298.1 hypothetical protein FXF46_14345 [Gluconobacter thailandicus]
MGGRERHITLSVKKRWWLRPLVRLYTMWLIARMWLTGLPLAQAEREVSCFIGRIGLRGFRVLVKE